MNVKKYTKAARVGLSSILIGCLMAVLLVTAAPPVSAATEQPVVTRTLPATVLPGEQFDVTVQFTASDDDFTAGVEDFAPAGWAVSADDAWCTPSGTTDATGNKFTIIWLAAFDSGTSFNLKYKVTVPGGATAGVYDFSGGQLGYAIEGGGTTYVAITGDSQVEILPNYNLTLSSTVGGSVTTPGEGTQSYISGTEVNIAAAPETGYEFDEWTGDVGTVADVDDATTKVTMNGDYNITAEFVGITPYLVVDKSVNPSRIGKKGSGIGTEVSRITLTLTYAGDPTGSVEGIIVTDTLPKYINLEDNFSKTPDSEISNEGDPTTLIWDDLPDLGAGEKITISFDVSSNQCGKVLANVVEDSMVAYNISEGKPEGGFGRPEGSEKELFPETYLTVRCPAEDDDVFCVVPPGGPAEMSIQNIYVDPEQAVQNQQVEVWVSIGNSGDTEGAKTVALYVNGAFVDSQTVSVGPGGGENVFFLVSRAVPGTYTVSIEGREAQFTVLGMGPPQSAPAPPMATAGLGGGLGTAGIIAIIVVVIALGVGLVVILRREST